MLGRAGSREGIFPVNFVDVKEPPPIQDDASVVSLPLNLLYIFADLSTWMPPFCCRSWRSVTPLLMMGLDLDVGLDLSMKEERREI